MSAIRAIETVYKGYRFRSRLEARWAVLFDAFDWKYAYEPEGFALGDGKGYLPDFRLDGAPSPLWLEIKPKAPGPDEDCWERYWRFAEGVQDDFVLLFGDPWPGEYSGFIVSNLVRDREPKVLTALVPCPCCGGQLMSDDSELVATLHNQPTIAEAFRRARGARFEHGEQGAPEAARWGPITVGSDGLRRRQFYPAPRR